MRCLQTNHEGQFIDWCHETRTWAEGVIVNPGRLDALQLRDPRRRRALPAARSSRCTSRTSPKREEWRRYSVLEDVVVARVIGKGPEGYREALVHLAGAA